mmetsp:Transcript_17088/g.41576  ORF Transcript_17088/g.41576 Transcript_17088/m.41576 type:complete len:150 (+) Transcript_17088:26-475(+)
MTDTDYDDDDDDFFGSQDNDDGDEYGNLGKYEVKSKQDEIEKVAFLQAYDDHAESRLQEGFEAGYQESFATAYRIGQMMGKHMTLERFKLMKESQPENSPAVVSVTDASCMVYQFSKEFQERANDKQIDNAKAELEKFEKDLEETIEKS